MSQERTLARKPVTAERRSAVGSRIGSLVAAVAPVPAARVLQQRLGNAGTQALAAPKLARKSSSAGAPASRNSPGQQLSISHPDDPLEKEAERVADVVMRMPEPTSSQSHGAPPAAVTHAPVIQRRCAQCEEEYKKPKVQRKGDSAEALEISPSVSDSIRAMKGGGSPLSAATRAFFEPRFGADFGQVRLHTDEQAEKIAKSINARAFTVGHNIAFGAGQFSPGSHVGRSLLAHELTHVLQQSGAEAVCARKITENTGPSVQMRTQRAGHAHHVLPSRAAGRIPCDFDVHTMSVGVIQRSADDDASSIKQKLKDAIDEAFRARDAWKATDNIGQAIYSERLGLLLGRKSGDRFASMQELDAYIAESDKAALTELDTMAKLGLGIVDRFPHVFPLTWAARVRDALILEVDLKSIKDRLDADTKYADSLAKRIPTSLFWWGLARTFAEALESEAPFELELRHAEWPKPHATRDFALGWIEYARTQAECSFYEFWERVVQSLSDNISTGKIKIDPTFQETYKDFVKNKRATMFAIPGKIRAFGPSQPELSGEDILANVDRVALVVNNISSLSSMLTFIPIWSKAETEHAAGVSENDNSIARLDENGRVTQAMLWAYQGDYFSEAGKRAWQAIKAAAKEDAAQMVGAMISQMIPYLNVLVDVYFLGQGVKGIDAALKGLQAAFVSASNAATTVDLQRESAKLAMAITGQGASLILSLLAAIGASRSIRAKVAKIRAKNPEMSDEQAINEALKDATSKEGAALRKARNKQPGFTLDEIKNSQQKAKELAKNPENVRAIDDPIYDTEIDLLDRKKYRRIRGKDIWCLFKNPWICEKPESFSEVNQVADQAAKPKVGKAKPSPMYEVVGTQERTTLSAAASFRMPWTPSGGYIYIIRGTRSGTTLVLKVGKATDISATMPRYTFLEKPGTRLGKQIYDKGLTLDVEVHAVRRSSGSLTDVEAKYRQDYGRGPWDRQIGPGERPKGKGVPAPNDNATLNDDLTWTFHD